jgi:hypothetical protein
MRATTAAGRQAGVTAVDLVPRREIVGGVPVGMTATNAEVAVPRRAGDPEKRAGLVGRGMNAIPAGRAFRSRRLRERPW